MKLSILILGFFVSFSAFGQCRSDKVCSASELHGNWSIFNTSGSQVLEDGAILKLRHKENPVDGYKVKIENSAWQEVSTDLTVNCNIGLDAYLTISLKERGNPQNQRDICVQRVKDFSLLAVKTGATHPEYDQVALSHHACGTPHAFEEAKAIMTPGHSHGSRD